MLSEAIRYVKELFCTDNYQPQHGAYILIMITSPVSVHPRPTQSGPVDFVLQ
jgi:hypothetical protein